MLYNPYKYPIANIEGLSVALASKANKAVIADEFDSTASYSSGDYVMYEGVLYKFTTSHTGAWDASDVTATLVSDEFGGGGGGTADITAIAAAFSDSTAYAVGQYVTYDGKLYKCTTAHAAGAWNASDFTQTTVDDEFMGKGRDYVTAGKKSGTTLGTNATAEGNTTEASGNYSHAEGTNTKATKQGAHAEGGSTQATGQCAHAEGTNTQATNSYAHAEGYGSQATGQRSHAEGYNSVASQTASHAEGDSTTASGTSSHAEGSSSTASHEASHAEGKNTQTGNAYQHVQGKYNVGKSTTAFEIGNGTGTSAANRSNALEVEWDGDVIAAGEITDGGGNVLSDKFDATSYVDRYERYTITASSWSASPDSSGYYTYSLTTSAYNTYKGVEMQNVGSADGVRATDAEKAAFNLVSDFYMADGTGVTAATLYAKTKPTTTFYIILKGNYAARNAASSTKALDITTGCKLHLKTAKAYYNGSGTLVNPTDIKDFDGSTERTLKFASNFVKLNATSWSSTVDSNGYYKYGFAIGEGLMNFGMIPKVKLIGNNNGIADPSYLPTSTEIAAYNLIDYFEMTNSISAAQNINAYAKTKPTTTIYIAVEGICIA